MEAPTVVFICGTRPAKRLRPNFYQGGLGLPVSTGDSLRSVSPVQADARLEAGCQQEANRR